MFFMHRSNISQVVFQFGIVIWAMILSACSETGAPSNIAANGADPGVLLAPIAFVKRPLPLDGNNNEIQPDLRDPFLFVSGGDVYLRSNSTVTASQINITEGVTDGQGDVKDLNPNYDGDKFLFSLRLFDENPNDDVIPSWNIYEYSLSEQHLRRIIDQDTTAEQGDDLSPAYLPDGRIIFSSNRQRQSGEILTNEGKPRFKALDEDENATALVLHVMNDNGQNIHQVSFNQSHDLGSTVLSQTHSGKVLFSRWDNAGNNNALQLYTITPDGTDLQVLYGVHSHNTGATNDGANDGLIQFSRPMEMEDGRIMIIARPFSGTFGGGDIVIIDTRRFANATQPVYSFTGIGSGAQEQATINPISTESPNIEFSQGGRYSSAWPLWDGSNRMLISKSTCTLDIDGIRRPCIEPYLTDPAAIEISPTYGIWLYDMTHQTQKVIIPAESGMVITDIIAIQSRALNPDIIPDKTVGELNAGWRDDGIGAIHIKSVYDMGDGIFNGCFLDDCQAQGLAESVYELGDPAVATADQRPARFVRFVKGVAIPDGNDPDLGDDAPDLQREAFGPIRNQAMREIIGYAPIEPDGSVKVKVPANIPLAINVLDRMGRRIGSRHQNWFQVRPGDTLECTGCHNPNTTNNITPNIHHRRDAETPSINSGLQDSAFSNTRIPGTTDAYWGNIGETMAEARFRLASTSIPPAQQPHVTAEIIYEDYWTNPDTLTPDTGFVYEYASLDTPSPDSASCQPATSWDFKCRIVINYSQHIHPLWAIPRTDASLNDVTCTGCHSNFDTILMVDKIPAGQLDLSDGLSDQNNGARFKSYRELFFSDAGEEIDAMGNLVNIQITQQVAILDGDGNPVLDIDGNPTFDTILIDNPATATSPAMSGIGARASYFIEKMTETELESSRVLSTVVSDPEYVDHSGFMNDHELRLISEWLDIGGQYFNNPFDDDCASMNLC